MPTKYNKNSAWIPKCTTVKPKMWHFWQNITVARENDQKPVFWEKRQNWYVKNRVHHAKHSLTFSIRRLHKSTLKSIFRRKFTKITNFPSFLAAQQLIKDVIIQSTLKQDFIQYVLIKLVHIRIAKLRWSQREALN